MPAGARWPAPFTESCPRNLDGFLRPHRPESATLRQGAGYAVMNFMAINPSEVDKALALRLLGAGDAGLYALASRGLAVVTLPVIAMVLSAQPRIFRESNSKTGGRSSDRRNADPVVWVWTGRSHLLYFAAPALLQLLLGSQYEEIGEVISAIAFIAPFMALRFATGGILLALGRPIWRAGIEGASLLVMIGFALTLTPLHGILGTNLGSAWQ